MAYELLLSITLSVAALVSGVAWRISQQRPRTAAALRREPRAHALVPDPTFVDAERIVAALAASHPGAQGIAPRAVRGARSGQPSRVRAVPIGTATHRRGAVRLMIILTPPRRVASAHRLWDEGGRGEVEAVKSRGAGERRRRR
jgi:hypothetical protein